MDKRNFENYLRDERGTIEWSTVAQAALLVIPGLALLYKIGEWVFERAGEARDIAPKSNLKPTW